MLALAASLSCVFDATSAFNLSPALYSSRTALSPLCVGGGVMCEQKGRAKPLLGPVMQLSASRKGGKGGKKGGKGKKGGTAIAKKDGDDKPRQTSQVLDTDKREYIYQVCEQPMKCGWGFRSAL